MELDTEIWPKIYTISDKTEKVGLKIPFGEPNIIQVSYTLLNVEKKKKKNLIYYHQLIFPLSWFIFIIGCCFLKKAFKEDRIGIRFNKKPLSAVDLKLGKPIPCQKLHQVKIE